MLVYANNPEPWINYSASFETCEGELGCTPIVVTPKNPPGCPSPIAGNPINIVTGNKFIDETDYQVTGSSSLQFIRHYNSLSKYPFQTTFGKWGLTLKPFGSNWSHNYYQGLTILGTEAKLTRANGQSFIFKLVSGAWKADADVNYRLQEILTAGVRTGWKVNTPDDMVENYNAIGMLLSTIDPTGLTKILTYSCKTVSATCPVATPSTVAPYTDLLIKVTDNFGKSLSFTYNSAGQIATMVNPAGNTIHYSYDTNGNLTSVTYPDDTPDDLTNNPKKTYVYGELANTANVNQPNALTGIIDENNVRYASYKYDTDGKAISTEHAGGVEKYQLTYQANSSSVTDPLGSVYTTNFQTVQGILKSTGSDQPAGSGCGASASALTYDANGNVASHTDFNGNRSCYAYNSRNLETVRVEGLAPGSNCPDDLTAYTPAANSSERKISTDWHPTFRLPVKIIEPGLETTYSYDDKGQITLKSLKDLNTLQTRSWTTAYTYAAGSGLLLKKVEDGPRTDVPDITTYDYYPEDAACTGGHFGCRGQLKQVTDTLGHITQISRYNAHSQPEELTDPNGLVTTQAYDAGQRLKSLTVGSETTNYSYDLAGLLTRVTGPDGAYLAYSYDDAHRLTGVKDQLGNTVTYTLDALGNRTNEDVRDPTGQLARTQSRVYDALSRLQNLVLPE
jgi:YD repeat-containing protein